MLGNFDAQLKMLLHEVLELLGARLLPLLVKLDSVVVLNNLLDTAPEELHHLRHVVGLAPQVLLLLQQLLLLFDETLTEFFSAHSYLLLGITLLFLPFSLKVFLHPKHLFDQVVVVHFVLEVELRHG